MIPFRVKQAIYILFHWIDGDNVSDAIDVVCRFIFFFFFHNDCYYLVSFEELNLSQEFVLLYCELCRLAIKSWLDSRRIMNTFWKWIW